MPPIGKTIRAELFQASFKINGIALNSFALHKAA